MPHHSRPIVTKRAGRPPELPEPCDRLSIYLPIRQIDRLHRMAHDERKSVSEIGRHLLLLGFKNLPALLAAVLLSACATKAPPVPGREPPAARPAPPQAEPPPAAPGRPTLRSPAGRTARAGETIAPNTPFTIAADHTGAGTTEYRLIVDGAITQVKPVSALTAGIISFQVAGWPPGTYQAELQAVNVAPDPGVCVAAGWAGECAGKLGSPITITLNAAPKWTKGDRVAAWKCGTPIECSQYGDGVAVRAEPNFNSPIVEVYVPGSKGTILSGEPVDDPGSGHRWWSVDYDGTGKDGWSTETNLVDASEAPAPVDCAGTWSEPTCTAWAPIDATTEARTCSRTFTATPGTPANGGKACPPSPETTTEKRPITPPPGGAAAPKASGCRWTLVAEPPDTSSGWRAQFRQNGIPIGGRDNAAPFNRVITMTAGQVRIDVEWTKATGAPPVLSAPRDLVCQ